MIGSLLLYVVCSLLYLVIDTFALLVLLRMIHGTGFGFGSNALSAIVFDSLSKHKRGQGAGLFSMAYSLLPAAGPVLTIWLVERGVPLMVFVKPLIGG